MASTNFQRLPYSIKPINYNIEFTPNTTCATFSAKETLKLQVVERTSTIILNSKNLKILSASYADTEAVITYDDSQELVIFTFSGALQLGEGELHVKFEGILSDDMQGFYRSTYKSPTGNESYILCTQFESVYARRAFPCMDEPDRKATFDISIIAPENEVMLSNMPEIARVVVRPPQGLPPLDGHNYVNVKFDTSPVMSTYLLAIVVGNFEFISESDANGVTIRVFTPPGKKSCGEFALEVAVKTLPFYANLFGHKFPLPKLDLIAIPDFGCGAMENWGLITYREARLLINHEQSSLLSKQSTALTVAHELAHMWFGNLVTMQWWTHLWLNEGFASWIEYLAVDYCFPNYDIWTMFVTREYDSALSLDWLKFSHPIEVEVNSPSEVEEIFDAVSYEKGACIIRMLNDYLGSEKFIAGLQHYINRYVYKNTVTDDLWKALSEVSGQPVEEIMSTWTKKMGYPILTLRVLSDETGKSSRLGIKQSRFLPSSSNEDEQVRWYIPVSICKADDSNCIVSRSLVPPIYDRGDESEHIIDLPSNSLPSSVRLNPGAIGFYRVRYDPIMMPSILLALSQGQIPERERFCLLNDHFAMAQAGHCPSTLVLNLARAFTGETRFSIWSALANGLGQIRLLLQEADYKLSNEVLFPEISKPEIGLNNLLIQLALPVYEKIGWNPKPDDSINDMLLRPIIISVLGRSLYPEVIESARCAFDAHYHAVTEAVDDTPLLNLIPPDLRSTVYSICMRNGGSDEFQRLLTLYDKATMQDERVRILSCLGSLKSLVLIERIFKLIFSDYVRKQDRYFALSGVLGSPGGRRAVWNLIKSRIRTLADDLATTHLLGYVIKDCCSNFFTQDKFEDVKAFFNQNPVPCARSVNQALETIGINMDQLSRNKSEIISFLNEMA